MANEHLSEDRWAYIGRIQAPNEKQPVGTAVCAIADRPEWKKQTAKEISKWVRDGLAIERVPSESVRQNLFTATPYIPERNVQTMSIPEGYVLVPIDPTPEIRFALSRAAGVNPGDVWWESAVGEWVWLNGILAALGGNQDEIEAQREMEDNFAFRHQEMDISGSTANTESGKQIRLEIKQKLESRK